MSRIIAVLNQKGGVGKTTTAINLGAYLARLGHSVLIIDIDPQGNATSGLAIDKEHLDATMYDVLFSQAQAMTTIHETTTAGLYILPANSSLAAAEVDLAGEPRREQRLAEAMQHLTYDYILIDCPPALGLLTLNALTAAQEVLIPVQAEYYALEGLGQLLDIIGRVRSGLNPKLEILGVVVTMFDGRTALAGQVVGELKKHFGDKLLSTVIPRNIRLAEAPSYGRTIADHDKWSKGARAYKQLAKEIAKRTG